MTGLKPTKYSEYTVTVPGGKEVVRHGYKKGIKECVVTIVENGKGPLPKRSKKQYKYYADAKRCADIVTQGSEVVHKAKRVKDNSGATRYEIVRDRKCHELLYKLSGALGGFHSYSSGKYCAQRLKWAGISKEGMRVDQDGKPKRGENQRYKVFNHNMIQKK